MPLHRLTSVSYLGGLPGTHDFINDPASNGDPGQPATVLTGKLSQSGHPNEGTYYIGFANDGTSEEANRPHDALAENTDFLDDVVSGQMPVIDHVDGSAGAPISSLVITGDIFMGMSGVYTNTQDFRDRLIAVLDANTLNELVDANGVKVTVSAIRDNTNTFNRVGAASSPGGDFETNPTINFSPPIPTGADYRIVYARRSSLVTALRTGTDRDFPVRTAIRNSHEVAAEVVRFMSQASRRTGGNITALAATIIETPGIGDNILPVGNSLVLDIDPDNTGGPTGGGTFDVRFNRDHATAVTNFRVGEVSPTVPEAFWENPGGRIQLADPNTRGSGFGEETVPLSSATSQDGDQQLRLLEVDPDSVGQTVSILRRLNAAWTVTCGDGVNTFGDFNGDDAVENAVTAAVSAGETRLHIRLKSGTFVVDQLSTSGLTHLTIEGISDSATLQNDATGGNAGIITAVTGGNLIFRHVTFSSGGNGSTVHIRNNSLPARIHLFDCKWRDGTLEYRSPTSGGPTNDVTPHIYASRCFFTNVIGSVAEPIIALNGVAAANAVLQDFVFEDCRFNAYDEATVLRIEDLGVTSLTIERVFFNRCVFLLRETTVNAGDPDNNTGVCELVESTAGLMRIRHLEWRDCKTSIDVSGAGDTRILLLLVSDTSGNYIAIDRVELRGGEWTAPATDNTLTPFYIGSANGFVFAGVRTVVIEDLDIGYGTRGGGTTTQWDYGATHSSLSVAAAVGVHAEKLIVRNVIFPERSDLSQVGEFYFSALEYDIRSVDVEAIPASSGGGFGAPTYRVRVQNAGISKGVVSGVVVDDGDASLGGIVLEPQGGLTVRDCNVSAIGGGGHGYYLVPNAASDNNAEGLSLLNCVGNGNSGDGFNYNQPSAALGDLGSLFVDGCTFSQNTGVGIRLETADGSGLTIGGNVKVTNNRVSFNVGGGILLAPDDWESSFNDDGIVCCHNSCYSNSGSGSGVQIQWSASGKTDQAFDAIGTCYANSCGALSGTRGQIYFFGGSSIHPNVHGIETGYSSGGASIVFPGDFIINSGDPMFHNFARYLE